MKFFHLALLLSVLASVEGQRAGGGGARDCSGQNNRFPTPRGTESVGRCTNFEVEVPQHYPDDFEGIYSQVKTYQCPESGKRIILSNSMPDHDVTIWRRQNPCEMLIAVELPLDPESPDPNTPSWQKTEIPIRGIVALAKNGVPAFGAQEGTSDNAVTTNFGASFWYGHPGGNSGWHVHNPHMGVETIHSETFLGWSMDGFKIFGPLSNEIVDEELDECNGRFKNGTYQYHVRTLDQVDPDRDYCDGSSPVTGWNYIFGCYSGDISNTRVVSSVGYDIPSDCVLESRGRCTDNPDYFYGFDPGSTCEWVAENPQARCSLDEEVRKECPAACDNTACAEKIIEDVVVEDTNVTGGEDAEDLEDSMANGGEGGELTGGDVNGENMDEIVNEDIGDPADTFVNGDEDGEPTIDNGGMDIENIDELVAEEAEGLQDAKISFADFFQNDGNNGVVYVEDTSENGGNEGAEPTKNIEDIGVIGNQDVQAALVNGDEDSEPTGDNEGDEGDEGDIVPPPPRKPNIILIQPDDLIFMDKWGRPPYNGEPNLMPGNGDDMPHIEDLRENGLQMLQAYTASPVCGTSRYSTITGKMPSRAASIRERWDADVDSFPALVTIPTTKLMDTEGQNDCSQENLAAAFGASDDYETAMIGKWHLTRLGDADYSYDAAVDEVKKCGFDHVGGLYIENLRNERRGPSTFSDGTFSHNMEWITYEAIKIINETTAKDKNFFMYFNPTVPHSSNSVKDAIDEFSCRATANKEFEWPGGRDPWIKGMSEDAGCEAYRATIAERAEASGGSEYNLGPIWLDDAIGALVNALIDNGIYENTLIVFQEDHGMDNKDSLYEGGIRIPQFVHYPAGIQPGTFDAPVSTIDLAPTLLEFAGINQTYQTDGTSWKQAVTNSTLQDDWASERCLFFENDQDRAIRCGCYKYMDLKADPQGESGTFVEGERSGLKNDFGGMLFDLCDGGESYVKAFNNTREMETTDNEQFVQLELATVLQCHMDNTLPDSDQGWKDCSKLFHEFRDDPNSLGPQTTRTYQAPNGEPPGSNGSAGAGHGSNGSAGAGSFEFDSFVELDPTSSGTCWVGMKQVYYVVCLVLLLL